MALSPIPRSTISFEVTSRTLQPNSAATSGILLSSPAPKITRDGIWNWNGRSIRVILIYPFWRRYFPPYSKTSFYHRPLTRLITDLFANCRNLQKKQLDLAMSGRPAWYFYISRWVVVKCSFQASEKSLGAGPRRRVYRISLTVDRSEGIGCWFDARSKEIFFDVVDSKKALTWAFVVKFSGPLRPCFFTGPLKDLLSVLRVILLSTCPLHNS